jgi:type II secretory pathway component PulF
MAFDARHALLKSRFNLKKRIALYERLAAFLESNINIMDTMVRIQRRYAKNKDFRARILMDWIRTMERGGRFGEAVQSWIPASEHMLISAGERGEGLIHGLKEATVMSTATKAIRGAIIGGAAMPAFLLVMLSFMLIKFQTDMVPVFKTLLPVEAWSSSGQTLNAISGTLTDWWWIILLLTIAGSTVIVTTLGRWRGPVRRFFDRLPPWSIYRTSQASSFMIGLSSLMKAGVASFDALKTMHRTSSPWMREHLEKMMAIMRLGGASNGRALNTGLLDAETAGDVEDYSQLGDFQDAIYLLGARAMKESVDKINMRMSVVRNIMLIVVAGSIIWIYSTVYGLQSAIATSLSSAH